MKIFGTLLLMFVLCHTLPAQNKAMSTTEYIDKYKHLAVSEMKLYGIPASITLAQGIIETASGNSKLAVYANNHFGIKCKAEWTGEKYYYDDDEKNECFRKYPSDTASYRDHSLFLKHRPYYTSLFQLELTDYKGWAYGLKKAGYATNPRYAEMLIEVIEKYSLFVYDRDDIAAIQPDSGMPAADTLAAVAGIRDTTVVNPQLQIQNQELQLQQTQTQQSLTDNQEPDFQDLNLSENSRKLFTVNGVRCVKALKNDDFESIAGDFNLAAFDIRRYNDMDKNYRLKAGETVFIEPKKTSCDKDFHIVAAGESLHHISQINGIQLGALCKKNRIQKGYNPFPGEKIWLKYKKP